MKKTLVWAGVLTLALVMGVGAAALVRPTYAPFGMMGQGADGFFYMGSNGYGMMGQGADGYAHMGSNGYGMMGQGNDGYAHMGNNGYGMMGTWNNAPVDPDAPRISLDQALEAAEIYANTYYSESVEIEEVMEFENNFYALFIEEGAGRGAFELLIDPYTGNVSPEPGPNMMWNLKYGHMGSFDGDNAIALDEARQYAQQALDADSADAELEGEGASFYGYFTFDYSVDGQMAGMLSVNGLNGQIFYHTWHGTFIQEQEY